MLILSKQISSEDSPSTWILTEGGPSTTIVSVYVPTGQAPAVTWSSISNTPGSVNSTYGLGVDQVSCATGTQWFSVFIPGVNVEIPHKYTKSWHPSPLTSERSFNWTISPGHISSTTSPDEFKISKLAIGFWSIESVNSALFDVSQSPSTLAVIV